MKTGLQLTDAKAADYDWLVRRVPNWLGGFEYMIELLQVDGCVGFGDTLSEAKLNLDEALFLWAKHHGVSHLPEVNMAAQLIVLEAPMEEVEAAQVDGRLRAIAEI
ncbi:type II toxin-antitoxin system HicB family antitoxin [Shouchella shacheensis]|uniref:type II toxin-antitoxin system HicB family antitoxin n=1 Tax=Shouchella shacheensis TaxID=1649580 RepID=UPI00073FBA10|nr:type II toxin-antitoxin system HicB family antitoxin [Shouchella shacheensis]